MRADYRMYIVTTLFWHFLRHLQLFTAYEHCHHYFLLMCSFIWHCWMYIASTVLHTRPNSQLMCLHSVASGGGIFSAWCLILVWCMKLDANIYYYLGALRLMFTGIQNYCCKLPISCWFTVFLSSILFCIYDCCFVLLCLCVHMFIMFSEIYFKYCICCFSITEVTDSL